MFIKAEKKIDIHRAEVILELKIKDFRPDLAWYLDKLGRWGLSVGETENIERYLEYLGLIHEGSLTKEGKIGLQTKNVMVPEAGLYQILFSKDPVFGNRVIDWRRMKPRDTLDGNIEEFEEFELYDEKVHRKLNTENDEEFWIRFQRQRNESPKIVSTGSIPAHLEIRHEDAKTTQSFLMNLEGKNIRVQDDRGDLNISSNISNWIEGWDKRIQVQDLTYQEAIKKPVIIKNMQNTIHLKGQSLLILGYTDDGDWSVEISVPVVPKTIDDAIKWMDHLLLEALNEKIEYQSEEKIMEKYQEILRRTKIIDKHRNFRGDMNNIMDMLKEQENDDLYYMTKAVEDLSLIN